MRFLLVLALLPLVACGHAAPDRRPSSAFPAMHAGVPWNEHDPQLAYGDLDVWKLQKMADEEKFDRLNDLFNSGVTMDRLPEGYAAGTGTNVPGLPSLTGMFSKGKIFFVSSPKKTHGLNRIKSSIAPRRADVIPMAAFYAELLPKHSLAPKARSNLVAMSYNQPRTKPFPQEELLSKFQIFELMTAIPGKHGPLYIGKTWLGHYDKGNFVPSEDGRLIAWFFLDFNDGAIQDQLEAHWEQGLRETAIPYRQP